MPDGHFENVNKHVQFKHAHGPKKDDPEPLIPQRLYIIHENIELIKVEEPSYNSIDTPCIKAKIEDAKNQGEFLI